MFRNLLARLDPRRLAGHLGGADNLSVVLLSVTGVLILSVVAQVIGRVIPTSERNTMTTTEVTNEMLLTELRALYADIRDSIEVLDARITKLEQARA